MKTSSVLFLIVFFASSFLEARAVDEAQTLHPSGFKDRLALKLEYYGELVLHPGLSAGVEYTLVEQKWVTLHWDSQMGGYWHRWNNTSVFIKTAIGSRFTFGSAFTDFNLGIGYMHSWVAGDVYQKSTGGGVEKATNWGHSHFIPNFSMLFGWDGKKKNHFPFTFYIGPEVYLQSAFNHTYLPHIAAKIGFTYKFNPQ